LLLDMGYAVLIVDSFNPRGVAEICTTPIREREIHNRHRVMDAYGALRYLNSRPDVEHGKIAGIGFSHGGSNALSIMDASEGSHRATGQEFAASVSMYPGCRYALGKQPQFSAYGPLLILTGEKDDWTPAAPCKELAERSKSKGEPVDI